MLELLAPARDLVCGKAAIDHGADAVYIGAPKFGAREAAGNSIEDIAELCRYAHPFGARIYVTVNTLVFDSELADTLVMVEQLVAAGVDALLVQDMGLFSLLSKRKDLKIALHASTQTDNRTAEKVAWLRSLGFRRVVLARELSMEEIAAIHRAVPDVELEVFVHGALCVSYSGQCYASQYCFSRSANRGACAQMCRMKYDLVDAGGKVIVENSHLLSLKDFCQIDNLERLAEAGAMSFKIEGRLKDVTYVKNVTAAYSQRLNQIVAAHPDRYQRASLGRCTYTFQPDLSRTFNRGYTTYFAQGRQRGISSPLTPKALGQRVGTVKEIGHGWITVAGVERFANGDGLCFVGDNGELQGFRVNRVENNRLFPLALPQNLKKGTPLFRNNDQAFERLLAKPSAVRKIAVEMKLEETADGFRLTMGPHRLDLACEHQPAATPQRENIIRQLTKLGNTPYECSRFELAENFPWFIPSSKLSEWKRTLISQFDDSQFHNLSLTYSGEYPNPPAYEHSWQYNIANGEARRFYEALGLKDPEPAFEVKTPEEKLLMQCRHCLRFELGHCVKHGGTPPDWREPLSLRLKDGRTFPLQFDCRHCQMNVFSN